MKRYAVKLQVPEKAKIKALLQKSNYVAAVRNRIQILDFSDKGLEDSLISRLLEVTEKTVCNVRKKYCEKGLEKTIYGEPRSGRPKKFSVKDEAELTALACSDPPEGQARWTLKLLQKNMSKPMGKSTVHLFLKKTNISHGGKKCGASGNSTLSIDNECTKL